MKCKYIALKRILSNLIRFLFAIAIFYNEGRPLYTRAMLCYVESCVGNYHERCLRSQLVKYIKRCKVIREVIFHTCSVYLTPYWWNQHKWSGIYELSIKIKINFRKIVLNWVSYSYEPEVILSSYTGWTKLSVIIQFINPLRWKKKTVLKSIFSITSKQTKVNPFFQMQKLFCHFIIILVVLTKAHLCNWKYWNKFIWTCYIFKYFWGLTKVFKYGHVACRWKACIVSKKNLWTACCYREFWETYRAFKKYLKYLRLQLPLVNGLIFFEYFSPTWCK